MLAKLALLPLLSNVSVEEVTDTDGNPRLEFTYPSVPGPGTSIIDIDIDHSQRQLRDLIANLPLASGDRLAALAIMLVPVVG